MQANKIQENLLAIDVDNVMLDYHDAYVRLWERVKGEKLVEVDRYAYWVRDRYNIPFLEGSELDELNSHKDENFWSGMIALPGAVQACHDLVAKGKTLVAISALPPECRDWRWKNLMDAGFPLHDLIAVGKINETPTSSAKAYVLNKMLPADIVDDHMPYFDGTDPRVRRVLIHRSANDHRSHNHDPVKKRKVRRFYADLPMYAKMEFN